MFEGAFVVRDSSRGAPLDFLGGKEEVEQARVAGHAAFGVAVQSAFEHCF